MYIYICMYIYIYVCMYTLDQIQRMAPLTTSRASSHATLKGIYQLDAQKDRKVDQ